VLRGGTGLDSVGLRGGEIVVRLEKSPPVVAQVGGGEGGVSGGATLEGKVALSHGCKFSNMFPQGKKGKCPAGREGMHLGPGTVRKKSNPGFQ